MRGKKAKRLRRNGERKLPKHQRPGGHRAKRQEARQLARGLEAQRRIGELK